LKPSSLYDRRASLSSTVLDFFHLFKAQSETVRVATAYPVTIQTPVPALIGSSDTSAARAMSS